MKKRKILIIHTSGVFLNIIKRTLTAEVPDIDLHAALSAREGIDLLNKEPFDMVISANEMEYMNGTGIYELMRADNRHQKTGFLLITSNPDRENLRVFKEKGITNVLRWPYRPGELAIEVEKLSQGRVWRRHKRIIVPETLVLIQPEHGTTPAEIVNISMGGMLCNLKVAGGIPEFSRFYKLNILFPDDFGGETVNAEGYILRQAALHWLKPPEPEILQTAWRLSPTTAPDRETMEEILDKAVKELEINQEK
ncbi:MAG: response regulator [bacterium]|nr:response regulator [bacterium]